MDRFIVGTGRCGSTLLSRMLAEHPHVLSVFEFFNGLDVARRFGSTPLSGPEFADLIGREQPFVTAVLRRGYRVSEIVYPFETGRYAPDDRLPWLLVTMLPRISDEPDALFDDLMSFARAQPHRRAPEQYRALFAWLVETTGRRAWIERSGSSIEYLADLGQAFPGARFLHLHRDGPEVALSMREHHAYRLPISLLYDVPIEDGTPVSQLGPLDLDAAPDPSDPISRILASRPPPEHFGRYWNDQVVRGYRALRGLDALQYAETSFETLVADPGNVLGEIADHLELERDTDGWRERAAALVKGTPLTRFDELPSQEQEALTEACRTGRQLLGRL